MRIDDENRFKNKIVYLFRETSLHVWFQAIIRILTFLTFTAKLLTTASRNRDPTKEKTNLFKISDMILFLFRFVICWSSFVTCVRRNCVDTKVNPHVYGRFRLIYIFFGLYLETLDGVINETAWWKALNWIRRLDRCMENVRTNRLDTLMFIMWYTHGKKKRAIVC